MRNIYHGVKANSFHLLRDYKLISFDVDTLSFNCYVCKQIQNMKAWFIRHDSIYIMALANGVAEVIVIDVRYPESFARRLRL